MPTRNRAQLLNRCLESILAQTHKPDLLVISDDGSTDDTAAIVQGFLSVCARKGIAARYCRHQPALGQEVNRRFCMEVTDTDLLAMVDDDDQWTPDFLRRMVAELDRVPEAAFASCGLSVIDTDGVVLADESDKLALYSGRSILDGGVYENLVPLVIFGMPFMLGATVFRRGQLRAIGYVPKDSGLVCDWALMCKVAISGATMVYLPERLSLYRIHPYGRASDQLDYRRDNYRWARRLYLESLANEYRNLIRVQAIRRHRDLVLDLAHYRRKTEAVFEAVTLARTWGVQALGVRGLLFLPLVLLGADRLRKGRRVPNVRRRGPKMSAPFRPKRLKPS